MPYTVSSLPLRLIAINHRDLPPGPTQAASRTRYRNTGECVLARETRACAPLKPRHSVQILLLFFFSFQTDILIWLILIVGLFRRPCREISGVEYIIGGRRWIAMWILIIAFPFYPRSREIVLKGRKVFTYLKYHHRFRSILVPARPFLRRLQRSSSLFRFCTGDR